jgi:hypothetical protein
MALRDEINESIRQALKTTDMGLAQAMGEVELAAEGQRLEARFQVCIVWIKALQVAVLRLADEIDELNAE